ncbi:MAG: hypothetical protein ACOYMI_03320 [Phycisphaerales bacterium]|jgi:hypothetical protein
MNRQRLTWIVIGVVFAALLVVRGMTGQGLGRVYVQREDVSYARIETRDANGATTQSWKRVAEADAADVRWQEWSTVPPKAWFAAQAKDPGQTAITLSWPRTIGLWLAAFFTLAIFSFLWADNVLYKLAEATVVGVSAAYWMVIGFWDTLVPKLFAALVPAVVQAHVQPSLKPVDDMQWWSMALALVLGGMMLWRLAPRGGWIGAWPLAFIVGVTAGLKIVSHVESDLMAQGLATMESVVAVVPGTGGATDMGASVWGTLANLLVVVGVLSALTYFLFSVEHKGLVGGTARVGVWYLMITFGAAFGFTVMGRIALLAARFEFLFDDWLWLIDPNHLRT